MSNSEEFKQAKDAVVASLFELSKTCDEVNKNVLNFFNLAQKMDLISASETPALVEAPTAAPKKRSAKKNVEEKEFEAVESIPEIDDSEVFEDAKTGDEESAEKKQKKKKDPNAPKKPLTTYILFSNKVREEVQKLHKQASQTDIAKEIAKRWALLSDTEKEPFQTAYNEDKLRYAEEMSKYIDAKEKGEEYIAPSALAYQDATKHKKEVARAKAAAEKKEAEISSPTKSKKRSNEEEDEIIEIEQPIEKKKKAKKSKKKEKITLD
ncbi:Hmo1 protein [Martiniozyma asiatica (nom. inval.)]|nr:Hmo1 protein [Martiniozyma asiatica]